VLGFISFLKNRFAEETSRAAFDGAFCLNTILALPKPPIWIKQILSPFWRRLPLVNIGELLFLA